MLDAVIKQIILLKPTIVTAAVGTVILIIVLLLMSKEFSWNAKNVGLVGFFYESSIKECVMLSTCLLKFFLVLSMLIYRERLAVVHIAFFGVLVVLYNLMRRNLKEMLVSLFNGAIIVGLLYVAMFLMSYLKEILFDVRIFIGLILLSIFLILYSLYDVAWSILNIVTGRSVSYKMIEELNALLGTDALDVDENVRK